MNDRRLFLKSLAAAGVTSAAAVQSPRTLLANESSPNESSPNESSPNESSPNETVSLGIMGVNNRGKAIASGMLDLPNTHIGMICDVDSRAAERVANMIEQKQKSRPIVVTDFQRILDQKNVDVLICAAPNHWHAPATILGCAAGKDVYVEKPCSQTAGEGEASLSAARRFDRVVQMGTQRRSWPAIIEAVKKIHAGEIGRTLYSRTWYNNRRTTIGHGKPVSVPSWLDWERWQGPAPRRDFVDNLVHYNWHWHWHWGNGELGNNGIHGLDVARWALDVTFPERVTASGGHYRYDDDQQTPDTMMVSFDFPENKTITWEGLSWSSLGPHDAGFGISVHGTDGAIVIRGNGYTHYDVKGVEISTQNGAVGDRDHFADFLDAVRTRRKPNADIEQAHRSTLLCHLGNIAFRSGGVVNTDPSNGHILNHPEAQELWTREYAPGWDEKLAVV